MADKKAEKRMALPAINLRLAKISLKLKDPTNGRLRQQSKPAGN